MSSRVEILLTETTNIPSPRLAAALDPDVTRDRLLLALSESIVEKGFADTVVADIVKRARVSRRTFYEEFSDRAECFIELCDRSTAVALDVIDEAADPSLPFPDQVSGAIDAYFAFMALDAKLTRSMLFETHGLGDRGLVAHRKIHHRFTDQLYRLAERARSNDPSIAEISYATASAVVAAIYELILLISEEPARVTVDESRAAAVQIVMGVAFAPPAAG